MFVCDIDQVIVDLDDVGPARARRLDRDRQVLERLDALRAEVAALGTDELVVLVDAELAGEIDGAAASWPRPRSCSPEAARASSDLKN